MTADFPEFNGLNLMPSSKEEEIEAWLLVKNRTISRLSDYPQTY